MEVITRAEALRQGKKKYFTGKPCRYGHIDWRGCISMTCQACMKIYRKGLARKPIEEAFREKVGFIDKTFRVFYDDVSIVTRFVKCLDNHHLYPDYCEGHLEMIRDLVQALDNQLQTALNQPLRDVWKVNCE